MSKLIVNENKKLILKQVLIEEHRGIGFEDIEKKIQDFENKVKLLNVQAFGPLVTKMSGTQIGEDGTLSVDYDIIVQAHDHAQYKSQFRTHERLTAERCVYVRFNDHPQFMQFATSAIDLHLYNNDIEDSGILYTVMVGGNDGRVTVDYFKPVM